MVLKVAVLQMRSVNRAYDENIKTIMDKMTEAKRNNADILLLPECFITGYDLTIDNNSAIDEDDLAPLWVSDLLQLLSLKVKAVLKILRL